MKNIRAKAKKFAGRISESIALGYFRALHRLGRCVIVSADKAINIPVMIQPGRPLRIVVERISPGHYSLEVRHTDKVVHSLRKSIYAKVRFSARRTTKSLADDHLLNYSRKAGPFCYLGGGKDDRQTFVQAHRIEVPHRRRWISLELNTNVHRSVNLDSITFKPSVRNAKSSPVSKVSKDRDVPPQARSGSTGPAVQVDFALYADIDPNVVDGSSVWLSSMATILGSLGRVAVLLKCEPKSNQVLSNISTHNNVLLLTPKDFGADGVFTVQQAVCALRDFDRTQDNLRLVVVRGLSAATTILDDRQFKGRIAAYLTDFYSVDNGSLVVTEDQRKAVRLVQRQAARILVQTPAIEAKLRSISDGEPTKYFELPPPIPSDLGEHLAPLTPYQGRSIRIGYAGKITPKWGVLELLEWAAQLRASGMNIELHVAANKISDPTGDGKRFRSHIRRQFELNGVRHYADLNRAAAIDLMKSMDFVWCYRPPELEDVTLELSTKLVEMAAIGARALCYPSATNRGMLGEHYPYYIADVADFAKVLRTPADIDRAQLSAQIRAKHSIANVCTGMKEMLNPRSAGGSRVLFAGHDFKFVDPFIAYLRDRGTQVRRDVWEWGEASSYEASERAYRWADVIFCEWGLANAVWYSQRNTEKKPLYVRIHLQEVNERARKFGRKIVIDNVSCVIFVSEHVRQDAIRLWGWPREKTIVIPNFVLDDEYLPVRRQKKETIVIGMVGIVPQRKRFDEAVSLLGQLLERGVPAVLKIKGHRPETLEFMHGPSRVKELEYYNSIYNMIESSPQLKERVIFDPWGNDVAHWYGDVDFVLSCSDFESFHYAVADGVLVGCIPLVWPWQYANEIYPAEWVVADKSAAVKKIEAAMAMSEADLDRERRANREEIVRRYGREHIMSRLSNVILN